MNRLVSVLPRSALVGLALVIGTAWAGPPLETDDPDTPGPGNWEINVASSLEKRGGTWEFTPMLDLNYGVGDRLQLKLKPRMVILDEPGRDTRSGLGNIQGGIKWRFLDEGDHGIAASVYPQLDFNPPGHSDARGLVDDGTGFYLPVQVARTFCLTRLYAETGANWREHRGSEWIAGLAAEHPLTDSFRLVGELRATWERGSRGPELLFNMGCKWSLLENLTVLASAGHTLREPRGEDGAFFSYFGLQTTF